MELEGVIGLTLCVLAGVAICTAGYLNVGDAWNRAVDSRDWARTTARITRAWKVNLGGGSGTTRYNVNYTFNAPETGGSHYGHSEGGDPDMETGDDVEVMYDPKGPYNNELPLNSFERWFYPVAYGSLTVVGAAFALGALVVAAVMIVDMIR